jgi:hypothetical protein
MCAIICPEAIIEVYGDNTTTAETGKKGKHHSIKEKP